MKTKDILNLNFKEEENKNKIKKVLQQIKPLSKYSDEIPVEILEKVLNKLCVKYNYYLSIFVEGQENNLYYHITIAHKEKSITDNFYSMCIYEMLAKSIILIYSKTRKK